MSGILYSTTSQVQFLSFFLLFLSVSDMFYLITLNNTHTHTHTQSVGLLWTRNRPVAEISTWQHLQETESRTAGGIRTRNPCAAKIFNLSCISVGRRKNLVGIPVRLKAGKSRISSLQGKRCCSPPDLPDRMWGELNLLLDRYRSWFCWGNAEGRMPKEDGAKLKSDWESRKSFLTSKFIFKLIVQNLAFLMQIMKHKADRNLWNPQTDLLTYSLHGAESFLSSWLVCS
jgi:hypothetical protein